MKGMTGSLPFSSQMKKLAPANLVLGGNPVMDKYLSLSGALPTAGPRLVESLKLAISAK